MLEVAASVQVGQGPVTTHLLCWEDAADALLEPPVKLVAVREEEDRP